MTKKEKGKRAKDRGLSIDEREKAEDLMARGWIKAWFAFEVQAADKKLAQEALPKHVQKLGGLNGVKILKTNIAPIEEIDAPEQWKSQGLDKLFSQIAEVIVLAQTFDVLLYITLNYGPSAVEVLGPDKIVLKMGDAQNSLAAVAEMMHKFAAIGLGGVVISQ